MKTILLCTSSENILKHWRESLIDVYTDLLIVSTEDFLQKYLNQNSQIILVLDNNFFINTKDYIVSILELCPNARILLLEDCPSYKNGKEFLPLGIKGYGNSRLSSINLMQALTVIDDDKVWLYPDFIQKMILDIAPSSKENKILESLTCKEKEVVQLVLQGYSNKMIASKEKITESTVKVHLHSIFVKLHVSDRLSLALLFK